MKHGVERVFTTLSHTCLVFQSVVLKLIQAKMEENKDSSGFLIDGYPRELQQGIEFENTVANM